MQNNNETVEEIVKIMRGAIYPISRCPDLTMRGYADRIEAAHRCEVEELHRRLKIAEGALNFLDAEVLTVVNDIIAEALTAIRKEGAKDE